MLTGPGSDNQVDSSGTRPANATDAGDVLLDQFGRSKRKLRLSLTDRCNFRCGYCMPDNPVWKPKDEILSYEELYRLAALCVERMGIDALRLTGGEPLMRRDVPRFVDRLDRLRDRGLRRISMTTNGVLLNRHADALADAGLDDLNVSIDSLDPQRFSELTGGGAIEAVLTGIRRASRAGLPMKLNCVAMRGVNEEDLIPLTRWAYDEGVPLRFIEFMPLDGRGIWQPDKVVPEREIIDRVAEHFAVRALPRTREPATYYELDGRYRIGVISTVSNPFCGSCDRVRITATGELYPCLFSPFSRDLKGPLRNGESDSALEALIRGTVWKKGKGFVESSGYVSRQISMHGLGG